MKSTGQTLREHRNAVKVLVNKYKFVDPLGKKGVEPITDYMNVSDNYIYFSGSFFSPIFSKKQRHFL